jgi:TPR repeat protein
MEDQITKSEFALLRDASSAGFFYQHNQGVPKDEKEAVRLFTLAAAQGHAPAQNNLGK